MKDISIKYNPFLISTQITIDGEKPRNNSSLIFGKQRLQEWADQLPDLLIRECQDQNFQIKFTGTSTDYEDLKLAFDHRADVIEYTLEHNPTLEISEVEGKVDEIFSSFKECPVPELRDVSITEAFKKAKNQEFEVDVIATMSSGKSTLINALLGKELMPARVDATTATIVKIINTDQPNYSLKAYDANGNNLSEYDIPNEASEDTDFEEIIKSYNDNPCISMMEIRGNIPFVSTVGMQLVLVDTPGPNNARNINHQKLTYEMLQDSDKSLVLYVLNGAQLGITDNEKLLDDVCKCMQNCGKQSRDRYIFALNKLDEWKPKDADRIKGQLSEEKDNLENRGILNPCLFPVSAAAAMELRTNSDYQPVLNYYRELLRRSEYYYFDSYYEYNHLPMVVKDRLQSILNEGDQNQTIEIHTGIVSIEQAISLYINKYARPSKIKDLVDSFNNKLNDLAAMENLQKAIREDNEKKAKIETQIAQIRSNLQAAEEAGMRTKIIDSLDLTTGLEVQVESYLNDTLKLMTTIIASNNGTKVEYNEAKQACKNIDEQLNTNIIQIQVKIDQYIKDIYDKEILNLVNEYTKYLEQLNLNTDQQDFHFNPINIVSSDLKNLLDANELIDQYKGEPIDEGRFVTVTEKKKMAGDRDESAVAGAVVGTVVAAGAAALDLLGGYGIFTALVAGGAGGGLLGALAGKEDREVVEKKETWESKMVTYVNMHDLVENYFQPLQKILIEYPQKVINHVSSETSKIKKKLRNQLKEIDTIVESKLNELSTAQKASQLTENEIREKENKLTWLENVQNQINELIMF